MDKPIWKYNIPDEYVTLLDDIKEHIRLAQYEALGAVNKELISKEEAENWSVREKYRMNCINIENRS